MDEKLKELMQELGNAINDSLSESDRIAAAIGEIKRAGYDVFLVLEVTIGFNKRDEADDEVDDSGNANSAQNYEPRSIGPAGDKIRWTAQDNRFLKALNILVDDDRD